MYLLFTSFSLTKIKNAKYEKESEGFILLDIELKNKESFDPKIELRECINQNLELLLTLFSLVQKEQHSIEKWIIATLKNFSKEKWGNKREYLANSFPSGLTPEQEKRIEIFHFFLKKYKKSPPNYLSPSRTYSQEFPHFFEKEDLLLNWETSSETPSFWEEYFLAVKERLLQLYFEQRVLFILKHLLHFSSKEIMAILEIRWPVYRFRLYRASTEFIEVLQGKWNYFPASNQNTLKQKQTPLPSLFTQNLLTDYIEGNLPPTPKKNIEESFQQFPEFHKKYQQMKLSLEILSHLPKLSLDPEFLITAINESLQEWDKTFSSKRRILTYSFSTIFIFLFISFLFLNPTQWFEKYRSSSSFSSLEFSRYFPLKSDPSISLLIEQFSQNSPIQPDIEASPRATAADLSLWDEKNSSSQKTKPLLKEEHSPEE